MENMLIFLLLLHQHFPSSPTRKPFPFDSFFHSIKASDSILPIYRSQFFKETYYKKVQYKKFHAKDTFLYYFLRSSQQQSISHGIRIYEYDAIIGNSTKEKLWFISSRNKLSFEFRYLLPQGLAVFLLAKLASTFP